MKIGLVLSGGASKCIAHLGVIQALEELGINIDEISGSSGGALLGSLYAAGIKPKEILDIILNKADFSFYFPSFKSGGLFSFSRLTKLYKEVLPVKKFEDLKIPITVVATDVVHGKIKYFNSGELIRPIIASSSYPVIFEPIVIDGNLYLDGGIMNNFPIEPLKDKVDKIIGISVGKVYEVSKDFSMQRMIFRSLELSINETDKLKFGKCDVFIEPEGLNKFSMFDFSQGKEIYEIGYNTAIKQKETILSILS